MVTVKNCSVVSKILAIQIIFYEPRPTNITIPNSITLYAVPVYELHIYIFVALQQGRRMAMEIDESVQCRPQKQQVLFRKKSACNSTHTSDSNSPIFFKYCNYLKDLQILPPWAPLAGHLLLGTFCQAPFARHLLPGISHQAPLASLTIIPCCKYFFF